MYPVWVLQMQSASKGRSCALAVGGELNGIDDTRRSDSKAALHFCSENRTDRRMDALSSVITTVFAMNGINECSDCDAIQENL